MDFSEILGAIVLGILAGLIARALLPGKQSMGLLMTMILGLAGSFVGFLIFAELFDIGDEDAFDLGGIIGAIIGAMLLLFLYERFARRQLAQARRCRVQGARCALHGRREGTTSLSATTPTASATGQSGASGASTSRQAARRGPEPGCGLRGLAHG